MLDVGQIADALDGIEDPWELLSRSVETAGSQNVALGTSGQLTGTAIIEGARQAGISMRIYTVDTLRLFPETLEYFKELESHYKIEIERVTPDDSELEKMINQHSAFLFFDSKAKQEYCCEIRKVRPNFRALQSASVWITGLRRDQSSFRKETPRVQVVEIPLLDAEPDSVKKIVKVAPLIDWNESQIRKFLADGNAPIHPLLQDSNSEWIFESLGCVICTTRQAKWEPPRAGRWRWFNDATAENKECGIHLPPPSQINV